MGLFKNVGHVLHKGAQITGGTLSRAGVALGTIGAGLTMSGIADPFQLPLGIGMSAMGALSSGAGMAITLGDDLGQLAFGGHPGKQRRVNRSGRSTNTYGPPQLPQPRIPEQTSVVRAYKETPNQIIIDRNKGYRRARSGRDDDYRSTKRPRTSSQSVKLGSINRISDI